MVLAISIGIGVVGLLVLALGCRGRTVGRDPHCIACGFNLLGLGHQAIRCPECGSSLERPDAVRQGAHRRRRGLIAIGAVVLAAGVGLTGLSAYTGSRNINWNQYKPAWLLEREIRGSGAAAGAIAELETRFGNGKLDQPLIARVIERALTRQADPAAAWAKPWADFLETARMRGLLSTEQVAAYARHAASVSIEARPRIAAGRELQIRAQVTGYRAAESSPLRLSIRHMTTTEGPALLSRGGGGGVLGLSPFGSGTMGSSVKISGPPGQREFTSTWLCSVIEGMATDSPPLATWEMNAVVPITVLPEGTDTVELVEDDSLRPPMEAGLKAGQFEVVQYSERWMLNGMINAQGLPMPAAFDVYARTLDGQSEWKLGSVNYAGSGGYGHGVNGNVPSGFAHEVVDLVLRPSVAAAERTIDLNQIWNGEVVIRGVRVKLPPEAVGEKK